MARTLDIRKRVPSLRAPAVWLLAVGVACASAAAESRAVLRVARSADGLEFRDAGLFAGGAAAPSLLRLSTGQVLAVLDRQPEGELCASQSRDGGASWSVARPIRLRGAGEQGLQASRGSLVQISPRIVRLYFVVRDPRRPDAEGGAFVASAVTRNGLDYELDRQVRVDARGVSNPRPIAVKVGSVVHLFLSPGADGDQPERSGAELVHMTSTDGRRFRPAREPQPRIAVGSVVDIGQGVLRMYAWNSEGVISLTAPQRREWQQEPGTRLAAGSEPAVTTLAEGSFLMVYSAAASKQPPGGAALVDTGGPSSSQGAAGATAQADAGAPGMEGWEPFAPGGPADAADAGADELATATQEPALPPVADLIPPLPDGENDIDYYEWLKQRIPVPAEGNAYDAYAQILHSPGDDLGTPKPGWPEKLDDMFNGDYSGPPFPWDPAQHPNWEASNQSVQNLLATFRQASLVDQYLDPLKFTAKQIADAPDGRPLLMNILLPSLADHRRLVRATLADAWRAENGQVVPDRMLTDLDTVLRASSHFQQGATLIHRLVGVAEQAAAEATARQALAQVSFTPEQLETGLQILQQHDLGPTDPAGFIPGETAMVMDITQRLLKRPAQTNVNSFTSFFGLELPVSDSEGSESDELAQFRRFGPAEAQKAAEATREYYARLAEMFRKGYPEVTDRDVRTLADQYANTNAMTQEFLPALSRVYVINARSEAGRRGTQLTWAANLFRARNGRWPSSLEELPADGSKMRTDPFSGKDFVYRLTPAGPTIYSASENGADDGGVHSTRRGDEESVKKTGGSDDYVFWPPQPK
jgi:hypothetical protein